MATDTYESLENELVRAVSQMREAEAAGLREKLAVVASTLKDEATADDKVAYLREVLGV